jgi:hypothetical protein
MICCEDKMEEFQEISLDEILEEQPVQSESIFSQIKKRKSNLNNDNFDLDVKLFEDQLLLCERPSEHEIYQEVGSWNFATPTKECFDRAEIVKVYARLNAYRHRLSELLSQCSRYQKIASTAFKSLKETAHCLYTGTASERNANAGYRVRPFEIEALYAEGILVYLTETSRALDSMFINLSANLKHIDNLMRVNHSYEDEGISLNYKSMQDIDTEIEEDTKKVMGMRVRSLGGN